MSNIIKYVIMSLLLIFLINNINLYSQLRMTQETKIMISKLETTYKYLEVYLNNPDDTTNVKLFLESSDEIQKLNKDKNFISKVQTNNSKYIDINNKIEVAQKKLGLILQVQAKILNDANNKQIAKGIKIGDNICYKVEDQRGGYISVQFQVVEKNEKNLRGFVTSITNYDPYNHLSHDIKSINNCTINNIEYFVRNYYYFSLNYIPNFKDCN